MSNTNVKLAKEDIQTFVKLGKKIQLALNRCDSAWHKCLNISFDRMLGYSDAQRILEDELNIEHLDGCSSYDMIIPLKVTRCENVDYLEDDTGIKIPLKYLVDSSKITTDFVKALKVKNSNEGKCENNLEYVIKSFIQNCISDNKKPTNRDLNNCIKNSNIKERVRTDKIIYLKSSFYIIIVEYSTPDDLESTKLLIRAFRS